MPHSNNQPPSSSQCIPNLFLETPQRVASFVFPTVLWAAVIMSCLQGSTQSEGQCSGASSKKPDCCCGSWCPRCKHQPLCRGCSPQVLSTSAQSQSRREYGLLSNSVLLGLLAPKAATFTPRTSSFSQFVHLLVFSPLNMSFQMQFDWQERNRCHGKPSTSSATFS